MSEIFEQIPPARSLIAGIRAIGYNFPTAVADIIDNSITAEATKVDLVSDPLADQPYFAIFDNGYGMNREELLNAMIFGSNREGKVECEEDLGRFGLGLKSASLSQCKKFTVVSKKYGKINALSYDINLIESENKWVLLKLTDEEIDNLPCIDMLKNQASGTIVVWTQFDKIEGAATDFETSFRTIIAETKKHVEFVFHRFYDKIEIMLNHKRVEKRDPFLKGSFGRQQTGRTTIIPVDGQKITVIPYSLPFADSLTDDEKRLLGNPKSIYDDQGFFIYRNKRLIYWGNWMHMGKKSEFNKLARVQVDIPSTLDSLWMLDVKKSYAKIPDKIKDNIRCAVKDAFVRSSRAIRFPGTKEQSEKERVWDRIKNNRDGTVKYSINKNNPAIMALNNLLGNTEKKIFEEILNQIECYLPTFSLFNDKQDEINIVNSGDDRKISEIRSNLINIIMTFHYYERENILERELQSECYKILDGEKESILKEIL